MTTIRRALRDESAYMLCGLWMIVGLYLDGWSHQANKPETFFTPWHALLYSGFGAAVLYSGYMAVRDARTGATPQIADDRITTFGVVLFAIGAIGDGIWHTVIGIEVDIEGLISPTHLMLMTGGLLMVTLPIRSALARDDERASKTVLASLTFAVAVAAFFLMYLSPFNDWWDYTRAYQPHTDIGNLSVQAGMARILVTTVLYVAPFLWAARRWSLPFGTATIAFTIVSFAQSGLEGFDLRLTLLAATVGGLVFDVLLRNRRQLPLVGAASAVAMWLAFFGLLHIEETVRWSPTLWAGALVFAGVTGLASGVAVRER